MKLNDVAIRSVVESSFFSIAINEDEEGPRWKFGYDGNRVNDPTPDILLLGAYRHPNTGNNLVGGINLNYITPEQRDQLAYALPEIMRQGNLKNRYWTGRKLVPEVFNNFYRTYNSSFIRGVQKDVMYPKYGYIKTAQNWLKKKLGGIFKSKEKRKKEAEPKYPEDLQSMQDRLDQAVIQLSKNPPINEPPDTPEMQAARNSFKDFQRQRTMQDIERQEDEPFLAAQQDIEQMYNKDNMNLSPQGSSPQEPSPREPSPEEIGQELEREQQTRQIELNDPDNNIDPDIDLKESIIYFSPIAGHYIIENFDIY